jgi:hypothetical protein
MSISDRLPAPLRNREPARPDVVVLEPSRSSQTVNPLIRLALNLAPDVFRALARNRQQQRDAVVPTPFVDRRRYTSGVRLSEVEVDTRVPFVRKVTVRRATAWSADLPEIAPPASPQRRMRWAGLLGIGSAFILATLGVLANRVSTRRP